MLISLIFGFGGVLVGVGCLVKAVSQLCSNCCFEQNIGFRGRLLEPLLMVLSCFGVFSTRVYG